VTGAVSAQRTFRAVGAVDEVAPPEEDRSATGAWQDLIVESSTDVLSVHAADGTFLHVSPACRRVLGYEPEALVGRSIFEIVHPEDQEEARLRRWITGEPVEVQTLAMRWKRQNGTYVWMESVVRRLPGPFPGEDRSVAVSRDIGARKRAEQEQAVLRRSLERAAGEWRATFDAIELPILLIGFDGTVCRINRAAKELFAAKYREIVGRPVHELGLGQPWKAISWLVQRVACSSVAEVFEASEESGSAWELEGSLLPELPDEEPKVVVQVRDITATVKLQESLRRSETMAVLGGVVAGVAHEVRNPLFGISAVLDAFEARFGEREELTTYLPILRGELQRMTELMQDLLDYGRPPKFDLAPEEIGAAIVNALRSCEALALHREVRLITAVALGGYRVLHDRALLARALKNLIENAIQHSAPASEVRIEALPVTIDGDRWIRISVLDRGPGFSEADLPSVFEPFFSRRPGGTGLGLSLVARIVDAHGGRIRADNRRTGGAMVEIDLPFVSVRRGG
jgi:PAS domain S-box-containing protein